MKRILEAYSLKNPNYTAFNAYLLQKKVGFIPFGKILIGLREKGLNSLANYAGINDNQDN